MKNIAKKAGKIALWCLGVLAALAVLVWGGLNLAKFIIYSDYYSLKTDICTNPGLSACSFSCSKCNCCLHESQAPAFEFPGLILSFYIIPLYLLLAAGSSFLPL